MKKILLYIGVLFVFWACEDVISLEVPGDSPRLVIDASLNWVKGSTGKDQSIKLSLTAPYFASTILPANQAQVSVSDEFGANYIFIEDGSTGIYKNDVFVPIMNATYELTIEYKNETYTATEKLLPVATIENIEQNLEGGFSGEETEIKAFYTDPANEINYYFFEFKRVGAEFPDLDVYDDEFTNGNKIFAFYGDEDLEIGDDLVIKSYGVSEQFYEFMFILLQQNSDGGGGPFETQPATVRGNCINTTNAENFPLGYFRVSESDQITYTVQ